MSRRRSIAAVGIASLASSGLLLVTSAPALAGGTGTAKIHFKGPDGSPVVGMTVCPTQHRVDSNNDPGKKEGKCGTSDKHGDVTLKKVKPGKWFVTIYSGDTVAGQFPKKIKVQAGKTTHKTYLVAG